MSLEGATFPLRQYLIVGRVAYDIINSFFFSNLILFSIITASVLVGVETYPTVADDIVVVVLDDIVLGIFGLEVLLKLLAEGRDPLYYFYGADWKWNNFDFIVVFFSLVLLQFGNQSIQLLRLLRLMRLAKFFQAVEPLRLIMAGLAGGLKSISYIVLLLFLILYIYAIAGIYFFRTNDPWHWRSIEISMMTLLGFATLSVEMYFFIYFFTYI